MKLVRKLTLALIATVIFSPGASSQAPAKDPAARLREVLPPDVAQRVLARIADARARQLPAEALENRALKFAAKGVDAASIERSVSEQAARMEVARSAIAGSRQSKADGDEIEAGAEALRKGMVAGSIELLARSAPSGRSLAVPLFVIASLTDRGLPSDQAVQRVLSRLQARASDADLETMPGQLPPQAQNGQGNDKGGLSGRDFGQSHRHATGRPEAAGPPAGVPGNAGRKTNPGRGRKPPAKR